MIHINTRNPYPILSGFRLLPSTAISGHIKNIFFTPILFLFFLFSSNSVAQNTILKKTLTIVDTTTNATDQSRSIYNWITHNIHYDVKSYLNGTLNQQTALETLKKRKGVCYDYALLFQAMCKSIHIESRIIYGYSKGQHIYKRKTLYRSDHCWIAIHADTSWILCDPTWGSGYLTSYNSMKDKIISFFSGVPVVRRKWKFIQSPDKGYFQVDPFQFRNTHLPLDPKWQMTDRAIDMNSFELDTLTGWKYQPEWKSEINYTSYIPEGEAFFLEGIQGKKFNSQNDFDLVNGYIKKANEFNLWIPIDSSNFGQFEAYLNFYKTADSILNHYRQTTDSVYKQRISDLKSEILEGTSLNNKLKNEHSWYRKLYRQKLNTLSRQDISVQKKIKKYEKKVLFFKRLNTQYFETLIPVKPDADLTRLIDTSISKSLQICRKTANRIDTVANQSYHLMVTDSILISEILKVKSRLGNHILNLAASLQTENNILTRETWQRLYSCYDTLSHLSEAIKQNQTLLTSSLNEIINLISSLENEFSNQANYINHYYQLTQNHQKALELYENLQNTNVNYFLMTQKLFTSYQSSVSNRLFYYLSGHEQDKNNFKTDKKNLQWFINFDKWLLENQQFEYQKELSYIKNYKLTLSYSIQEIRKGLSRFYLKRTHPKNRV